MAYTNFDVRCPLWLESRLELSDILSYISKDHPTFSELKIFISYAWDTQELQTMLIELKKILVSAGIPANNVFLDITGQMHGNLKDTMQTSLAAADRVLLISTKQYRERMQVEGSGVHVEYSFMSSLVNDKTKSNNFIVPLMFDKFEYVPEACRSNLAYNCLTMGDFVKQIIPILKELFGPLRDDKTFEEKVTVFDLKMKLSLTEKGTQARTRSDESKSLRSRSSRSGSVVAALAAIERGDEDEADECLSEFLLNPKANSVTFASTVKCKVKAYDEKDFVQLVAYQTVQVNANEEVRLAARGKTFIKLRIEPEVEQETNAKPPLLKAKSGSLFSSFSSTLTSRRFSLPSLNPLVGSNSQNHNANLGCSYIYNGTKLTKVTSH